MALELTHRRAALPLLFLLSCAVAAVFLLEEETVAGYFQLVGIGSTGRYEEPATEAPVAGSHRPPPETKPADEAVPFEVSAPAEAAAPAVEPPPQRRPKHCQSVLSSVWAVEDTPFVPLVPRNTPRPSPDGAGTEVWNEDGYSFTNHGLGTAVNLRRQGPELLKNRLVTSLECEAQGLVYHHYTGGPGLQEECFGENLTKPLWIHMDGDSRIRDMYYDLGESFGWHEVVKRAKLHQGLVFRTGNILLTMGHWHDNFRDNNSCDPLWKHPDVQRPANLTGTEEPDVFVWVTGLRPAMFYSDKPVPAEFQAYARCNRDQINTLLPRARKFFGTTHSAPNWERIQADLAIPVMNDLATEVFKEDPSWTIINFYNMTLGHSELGSDVVHWTGVMSRWCTNTFLNALCPFP